MKAYAVDHYGPDGLRLVDVPAPVPGEHDVLVDIRAASVNPLDVMVRNGAFKQILKYKTPFVLGHDVSGVVIAIGAGVTGLAVGDEVYARPRDLRIGTFAEQIAIDAADVARKPSTLTFEEAAAVPLVALAAWQLLVDVAAVRPGQKVLVHAGAGGLGSTVIQVAKHLGAHVTTTVSAGDVDRVRSLGADETIDYTGQNFAELPARYDVVIDSLGGASLDGSFTVLRPGGLAISVVGPPDPDFATQIGKPLLRPVLGLASRKVRGRAKRLGVRYAFFFMQASGAQLTTLAALYDDGTLHPVLDRTFDFDQTIDAVSHVEQGKAKGKIVITHRPT